MNASGSTTMGGQEPRPAWRRARSSGSRFATFAKAGALGGVLEERGGQLSLGWHAASMRQRGVYLGAGALRRVTAKKS